MKKIILTSVLAVAAISSLNANAASTSSAFCASPNVAGNATATAATATDSFIKVAFTPKCSANVFLTGADQNAYFGVGSASSKGKTAWVGSTAGGSVTKDSTITCAASGCTSANAASAAANAPAS